MSPHCWSDFLNFQKRFLIEFVASPPLASENLSKASLKHALWVFQDQTCRET